MQRLAKFAIAALAGVIAAAVSATAQDTLRAAAVINDEIVSMLDLEQRTRLAVLSSGLKDTPQLRRRMQSQVVRGLIDERLQAQEAERLDIKISDEQIDAAIADIAQQNNMPREKFLQALESQGIIAEAFKDQVRAQLTWQSLLARRIRPSAQVSDEEVEDVVVRVRANEGAILWLISEIFLSVDSPSQDQEVRGNAERIYEELRAKAEFGLLARQFSESATAPRDGDVGWVQKGQLPEELDTALEPMQPGQVSRPIRTLAGYHIIWLRDSRRSDPGEAKLGLKQILFALPPNPSAAQREQTLALARDTRTKLGGCEDADGLAKTVGSPGSGDLGQMSLRELPPPVREAVGALSVGQTSQPVALPAGISLLIVCSREDGDIDRERIRQRLMDDRLNILARRFMRDLRRDANVEVRI